jgi:hypothetical protein
VLAIDQECGKPMKRIMLPIVRDDRAAIGSVAIAPVLMTVVALALTSPAFAQFTPNSPTLSDAGDAAPSAATDSPADVLIEGIELIAAADAGSASGDVAADHSDWVRSDDKDSDNGSRPDKVLEVPQVVDPVNAQASAGGSQGAPGGDASSQDQVGSIDDYQDEGDGDIGSIYIFPGALNPYAVGTFRAHPGPLNPAFKPGYVPINPSGSNLGRPGANGMNTAIGSTSPMLPAPRNMAPMPGGWWNRAR